MIPGLYSVSGSKRCQLRMLKLLCKMSLSYRDALLKKNPLFFKGQVGLWLGLDSEAAKTICLHTLISFPPPQISLSTWLVHLPSSVPPDALYSGCVSKWQPHWSNWSEKYSHRIQAGYGDPLIPFFFPSCLVRFFHLTESDSMLRSPISLMGLSS